MGTPLPNTSIPAELRPPFERYLDLLEQWTARIDLVAPAPRETLRVRHLFDALETLRPVPPGPARVADLGSGAGLPGIPWALARPELQLTLVEPRGRRVAFLRTACRELGLSAEVVQQRAEQVYASGTRFDGVVARALAPPPRTAALGAPLVRPGGWLCLLTGDDDPAAWDLDGVCTRLGLAPEREHRYCLPGVEPRRVFVLRRRDPA